MIRIKQAGGRYEGKWDRFDDAVYDALSELGPCTARKVASELRDNVKSVACALVRLEARGKARKVSRRQDVYTWEAIM